jgi:hypothetical protein
MSASLPSPAIRTLDRTQLHATRCVRSSTAISDAYAHFVYARDVAGCDVKSITDAFLVIFIRIVLSSTTYSPFVWTPDLAVIAGVEDPVCALYNIGDVILDADVKHHVVSLTSLPLAKIADMLRQYERQLGGVSDEQMFDARLRNALAFRCSSQEECSANVTA